MGGVSAEIKKWSVLLFDSVRGGNIASVKKTSTPKRFRGPYEAHSLGGKASWAKMTTAERSARARKAALAPRLKRAA